MGSSSTGPSTVGADAGAHTGSGLLVNSACQGADAPHVPGSARADRRPRGRDLRRGRPGDPRGRGVRPRALAPVVARPRADRVHGPRVSTASAGRRRGPGPGRWRSGSRRSATASSCTTTRGSTPSGATERSAPAAHRPRGLAPGRPRPLGAGAAPGSARSGRSRTISSAAARSAHPDAAPAAPDPGGTGTWPEGQARARDLPMTASCRSRHAARRAPPRSPQRGVVLAVPLRPAAAPRAAAGARPVAPTTIVVAPVPGSALQDTRPEAEEIHDLDRRRGRRRPRRPPLPPRRRPRRPRGPARARPPAARQHGRQRTTVVDPVARRDRRCARPRPSSSSPGEVDARAGRRARRADAHPPRDRPSRSHGCSTPTTSRAAGGAWRARAASSRCS